ncbi:MAG: hypothetical protein KKG25_04875 [Bacteroidetes bacterium]|nr:hypothetical protein [Bacteroidota bacterium]MBU1484178.1 hypothetical protein [Bacteroidota bacterium]MBU2267403.1 hypothetical protein [Bacteroidota bacterium]MBU2375819.1 hypothetical protein [Bacteroidota bacterium]
MKKSILLLSAIFLFVLGTSSNVLAQANYKTGIGIRGGGYENGISIKHFTNSSTAIEGIIGFRPGVFIVTGLYEKHAVAFSEPSVNWFYGAGAHIGGINGGRYYKRYSNDYYYANNGILLGADGILGLEWKIPEIPFALSADLHPRLELAKGPFLDLEAAATLRFTF